jgi:conjugative relaxase-like TrwC/TraI family protein
MLHWNPMSGQNYVEYLEKEKEEPVNWRGKSAELLGIEGVEVTRENFGLLERGIEPIHGEVLRPRERYNLTQDGKIYAHSRVLYEVVIAPPKSVSILSLVDDRLPTAHKEALGAISPAMESLALTRVRKGGVNENRETGNLLYADWHHKLSRTLDPQQHTHRIVMNITYDSTEGQWKALKAWDLLKQRHSMTERYREFLAHKVESLGYSVEEKEDRQFGWELSGVSPEVIAKYSQRSDERDEALEEFEEYQERPATYREKIVLMRNYRDDKQYLPAQEVRERQMARLSSGERASLVHLKEQAQEKQVSYSWDLNDHITAESATPYQKSWSYGEKPKNRAF